MSTGNNQQSTYDIIFAGGGTVACIIATRLLEADPGLRILILEAGAHTKDVPGYVQPARCFRNFFERPETFTFHAGKPSDKCGGRSVVVSCARCVGGGSSANFMAYARAAASDYDDWETVHENKGWGSKHLIPLLKKAETYQEETTNDTHGTSGPLKISFATSEVNVADDFLQAALQYDKDRGALADINALYECNGYGRWARFIDKETGRRSDVAHYYLYPLLENNKNLTVLDRKRVVRVLFEGTRAVGVEYVDDTTKSTPEGRIMSTVFASRYICVSAGAFGSPAILERSGIGGGERLHKYDIKQVVDLPGVGEGYMDHNAVNASFLAAEEAETLDPLVRGNKEQFGAYASKWLETGDGLLSHNSMDAGIKLRPTPSDLEEIGPRFKERWTEYFRNAPDKSVTVIAPVSLYLGMLPQPPERKFITMLYYPAYPVSRGRVHISSGLDPYAPLDFEPGYFNDDSDVDVLRWTYKHARELARRMSFYRGELVEEQPSFSPGSEAAVGVTNEPVPINAPPIKYTAEDDNAIDQYNRLYAKTMWHSCGTCAMKPREKGGVVDQRLNVYGVQNLKVADLSIMPSNVGANTCNTAIAVGEKAAIIFAQDLGIKSVTESD